MHVVPGTLMACLAAVPAFSTLAFFHALQRKSSHIIRFSSLSIFKDLKFASRVYSGISELPGTWNVLRKVSLSHYVRKVFLYALPFLRPEIAPHIMDVRARIICELIR